MLPYITYKHSSDTTNDLSSTPPYIHVNLPKDSERTSKPFPENSGRTSGQETPILVEITPLGNHSSAKIPKFPEIGADNSNRKTSILENLKSLTALPRAQKMLARETMRSLASSSASKPLSCLPRAFSPPVKQKLNNKAHGEDSSLNIVVESVVNGTLPPINGESNVKSTKCMEGDLESIVPNVQEICDSNPNWKPFLSVKKHARTPNLTSLLRPAFSTLEMVLPILRAGEKDDCEVPTHSASCDITQGEDSLKFGCGELRRDAQTPNLLKAPSHVNPDADETNLNLKLETKPSDVLHPAIQDDNTLSSCEVKNDSERSPELQKLSLENITITNEKIVNTIASDAIHNTSNMCSNEALNTRPKSPSGASLRAKIATFENDSAPSVVENVIPVRLGHVKRNPQDNVEFVKEATQKRDSVRTGDIVPLNAAPLYEKDPKSSTKITTRRLPLKEVFDIVQNGLLEVHHEKKAAVNHPSVSRLLPNGTSQTLPNTRLGSTNDGKVEYPGEKEQREQNVEKGKRYKREENEEEKNLPDNLHPPARGGIQGELAGNVEGLRQTSLTDSEEEGGGSSKPNGEVVYMEMPLSYVSCGFIDGGKGGVEKEIPFEDIAEAKSAQPNADSDPPTNGDSRGMPESQFARFEDESHHSRSRPIMGFKMEGSNTPLSSSCPTSSSTAIPMALFEGDGRGHRGNPHSDRANNSSNAREAVASFLRAVSPGVRVRGPTGGEAPKDVGKEPARPSADGESTDDDEEEEEEEEGVNGSFAYKGFHLPCFESRRGTRVQNRVTFLLFDEDSLAKSGDGASELDENKALGGTPSVWGLSPDEQELGEEAGAIPKIARMASLEGFALQFHRPRAREKDSPLSAGGDFSHVGAGCSPSPGVSDAHSDALFRFDSNSSTESESMGPNKAAMPGILIKSSYYTSKSDENYIPFDISFSMQGRGPCWDNNVRFDDILHNDNDNNEVGDIIWAYDSYRESSLGADKKSDGDCLGSFFSASGS